MSNVNAQRFGRIGIDELSSLTKTFKVVQKKRERKTVDNDDDDDDDDEDDNEME